MTVRAWRIVKARHAASAFAGEGARQAGGRWTRPGIAVVYVAESVSLAMLEMLVHLQAREMLRSYRLFEVTFDDAWVTTVDRNALPATWRRSPPPTAVQQIGDTWIAEGKSAILKVPSVIVPTEWNYVLNPAHPRFARIAIGPARKIEFDPRLVKSSQK